MADPNARNARREELLRQVREYHRHRLARVFGRARWARRFSAFLLLTAFVLYASESALDQTSRFESFRHLCNLISDGESLEAARGLAAERRLRFDEDPNTSSDTYYVLRPDESWPFAPGCRFRAQASRVYRER